MTVYYLIFGLTLLLSLLALHRQSEHSTRSAAVLVFVLVGLLVTSVYGSQDYFSYRFIYENIYSFAQLGVLGYLVNVSTPVEPGFALAVLIEKHVTGSFIVFWFVFTAISLLVKIYAFDKLSPFLALTVLIYRGDEYFWKELSGIRGTMASGLVLLGIYFAATARPWKFLLAILLATSIHFAAIVAFPLYHVRKLASSWLLVPVFLASVFVAGWGGLGMMLPELAAQLGLADTARIIKYANSQYASGIQPFGGTFLLHLLIVGCLLMSYRRLVVAWKHNAVLIPVYIYGTSLMFVFIDYGIIAGRIREMLCVPVGAVLLPSFLLLFKGHQRLVPYGAVAGYAILWFLLMIRDRAAYESVLLL
jgi:hypothetical protein